MGVRVVALAIVLVCGAATAHAEEKPWAVGVTEENQKKALEKFQAGNDLFVKDEWRKALDVYVEAITFWDHPNIRYNAAICLIKLDRMVEAYEHMTAAMRHGEAPLGKDLHEQGKTYVQVLKSSVSYIEVVCKEPNATVTLDGQLLVQTCPGTETRLVKPGTHQIVGAKEGYKTETRSVDLAPGKKETIILEMRLEGTRKLTRRWPRWVPWSVLGVGAAMSVAAVPLFIATRDKFDSYETDLANACSTGMGCAPGDSRIKGLDDDLSSAKTYRALTISSIAVGATGVGVGILLLVMNQPRYASVTPMAGADRVGVAVTTAW